MDYTGSDSPTKTKKLLQKPGRSLHFVIRLVLEIYGTLKYVVADSIVQNSRSSRNSKFLENCLYLKKDVFSNFFFVPKCTSGKCLQSLKVSLKSVKYV